MEPDMINLRDLALPNIVDIKNLAKIECKCRSRSTKKLLKLIKRKQSRVCQCKRFWWIRTHGSGWPGTLWAPKLREFIEQFEVIAVIIIAYILKSWFFFRSDATNNHFNGIKRRRRRRRSRTKTVTSFEKLPISLSLQSECKNRVTIDLWRSQTWSQEVVSKNIFFK